MPAFGYDDDAALCLAAGGVPGIQIDQDNTDVMGYLTRPSKANLHVSLDGGGAPAKICIEDPRRAGLINSRDGYSRTHAGPGRRVLEDTHAGRHPGGAACAGTRDVIELRARQAPAWQANAGVRWEETQRLDQVFIAV